MTGGEVALPDGNVTLHWKLRLPVFLIFLKL